MIFYLYFVLAGILMFIFDAILFRLRKQLYWSSYLVSGAVSGILLGLLVKGIYHYQGLVWGIFPIVTISAAVFLFLFAKYELYQKAFFYLFATVSLGVATGILALIIIKLIAVLVPLQNWQIIRPKTMILDMIIYGFILHFGYAFTGRFHKKKK